MSSSGEIHTSVISSGVLAFTMDRSDASATAASASVKIDYSKFRNAFGADWASRLDVVQYPACVLSTPEDADCSTPKRLSLVNDVGDGQLTGSLAIDPDPSANPPTGAAQSATPNDQGTASSTTSSTSTSIPTPRQQSATTSTTLPVSQKPQTSTSHDSTFATPASPTTGGGSVFVLAGSSSSPAGTLTATDLRESSRWQAGKNTGDFTWSYPIPAPKAAVGPTPDLELAYSSQSVDGFTAESNSQPSSIGLGWDLTGLGYIERQYRSCDQDRSTIQDDCWYTDNATMNLNGQSTRLIKGGTVSGTSWVRWYAEYDPGWMILQRFDAAPTVGNGTYNNEWWEVITPDGTKYSLGYGEDVRSTPTATNSAWTVPVYGNNVGEPCNSIGYCTQGWRWNLDRITDTNSNQTTVTYSAETNYYNRHGSTPTQYVRGGAPTEIDYSMVNSPARIPDKVIFNQIWRCVENMPGGSGTCGSTGASWPDVPIDMDCGSSSCSNDAPTFYSKYMLDTIDTYTTTSTNTARNVDELHLIHALPNNTDGSDAKLWISDVQRTGDLGGAGGGPTVAPTVHFVGGTPLNNRADYDISSGVLPMKMFRVSDIVTALGGEIDVTYGRPDKCNGSTADPLPSGFVPTGGWAFNHYDCFPYWYVPRGGTGVFAINNKYLATEVDLIDLTGASPTQAYTYSFLDNPAWHYEEDPLIDASYQTWSDWRGYSAVRSQTGTGTIAVTTTKTIYYQGIDGDYIPGGTRSHSTTDDHGGSWPDSDFMRGRVAEDQQTENASPWNEITSDVHIYTNAGTTATMSYPSNPPVYTTLSSEMIRESETDSRRASSGGTILSKTRTTYDSTYGMPTATFSDGLNGPATDNTCVKPTYARNVNAATPVFIADRVYQAITYDNLTTTSTCSDGTALAKTNTFYDGSTTLGTQGTHGNRTEIDKFKDSGNAAKVTTTYDARGRVTETDGPYNESNATYPSTMIAYTPSDYNVTTSTTTTDDYGETTVSTLEPERGLPTSTVDMRNKTTTMAYDGLGRLTSACLPANSCATLPSDSFVYTVDTTPASGATPAEIETDQLQSGSIVKKSFAFLDGWGRPRETQYDSPVGGGGVNYHMSATCYDVRGLTARTQNPFHVAAHAGDNFNDTCSGTPSSEHRYTYDQLGRQITDQAYTGGTSYGGTATTSYDGLTTTNTSPQGRETQTIADIFGRTTDAEQLTTAGAVYADTQTAYDLLGCVSSTQDQAGHVTNYDCDWLSRHTKRTDVRGGTGLDRIWTYELNDHGDIHHVHDPNNHDLTTHYDNLWRPVQVFDSATESGTVLNGWTRTTTNHTSTTGLVTTSTRNEPALSGSGTDTYTIGYAYDGRARVTTKTFTLPTSSSFTSLGFASSYAYTYTYDSADHLTSTSDPAAGGLAAETITTGAYNTFGDPGTLSSGAATYISSRAYDYVNRPTNQTFGSSGGANDLTRSYSYDTPTQLLAGQTTDIQTTPSATHLQDDDYQYDHDLNLIKITDTLHSNQNQCFTIDDYQRLSQAWTSVASACTDYASPNNGSAPNPYKIQYNYDTVGRTTSIVNTLPSASTNTLSHTDTQTPFGVTAASSPSNSYTYDADGQEVTRNVSGQPNSTLTWTDDNLLRSYAPTAGGTPNTQYRYDADGTRILRQENGPTSSTTTLYLDQTEVASTSGVVTATRYIKDGDTTIGYRNATDVYWLVGNNQNSASFTTEAHSTTFQSQQYLPFGNARGASILAGTEHEFLDKTEDNQTGLDQLGARYYDPLTTNFVSTDLVFQTSPNAIDPYNYANNNPTTGTDPTGLLCVCGEQGYHQKSTGQTVADVRGTNSIAGRAEASGRVGSGHSSNSAPDTTTSGSSSAGTLPIPIPGDASTWSSKNVPTFPEYKINRLFSDLYRDDAKIGDGSSMDALIYELENRVPVGNTGGHLQKLQDSLNRINNIRKYYGDSISSESSEALDTLETRIQDTLARADQIAGQSGMTVESMLANNSPAATATAPVAGPLITRFLMGVLATPTDLFFPPVIADPCKYSPCPWRQQYT